MKANRWLAIALVAVLAVGVIGLSGCGTKDTSSDKNTTEETATELTGSINIEGSDTIVNMGQAWAEKFMEANPGVMISVKGGGSGTGIAALINGTVDFADASREMKQEEIDQAKAAGVDPVETVVAKDGISVIVNPANGVTNLTLDQLGKIYRGEITNWKDLGGADAPIVLLGRDSSSGTYGFIQDEVVGKNGKYAKSMLSLQSNQAIVDEVAKNPNAIGYVGLGYDKGSIKTLTVGKVAPSVATVLDGSYPLSRPLNMISNGQPTGLAAAYLQWILGADGQKIVAEQGFVPLSN